MPLLIREEEVVQLLPMDTAIAAVEEGLRLAASGRAVTAPRQRPRAGRAIARVRTSAGMSPGLRLPSSE